MTELFPNAGKLCADLGYIISIGLPAGIDPSGELVDIVGGYAQQLGNLVQLFHIKIDDIAVNTHFSDVGTHVADVGLLRAPLNIFPVLLRHLEIDAGGFFSGDTSSSLLRKQTACDCSQAV